MNDSPALHLEVDCTTGMQIVRAMTADEQAAQAAAAAARLTQEAADQMAAADAAEQHAADVTSILGAMPTLESRDALARILARALGQPVPAGA